MSGTAHDPENKPLEEALKSLQPLAGAFDRDRLMYRAGQASAPRRSWAWPALASVLALTSAGLTFALVLQPAGIVRGEGMGDVALQIIRECAEVARAEGANLEENVADLVLAAQRAAPADSVNSMLADRQAGRPTEIDARNGVIVLT